MSADNMQERIERVILETLQDREGAGSDLESCSDRNGEWVEVHGNIDVPHLAGIIMEELGIPQLVRANRTLAESVAGIQKTLEEGKRKLMAFGWDSAARYAEKQMDGDAGDVSWIKEANPWIGDPEGHGHV